MLFGSRESSPTRTMPPQSATLTTEAMLKLYVRTVVLLLPAIHFWSLSLLPSLPLLSPSLSLSVSFPPSPPIPSTLLYPSLLYPSLSPSPLLLPSPIRPFSIHPSPPPSFPHPPFLSQGVGGSYDDDDNASVTSERSTFSISSEVSISPYTKYPTPVTVSVCPFATTTSICLLRVMPKLCTHVRLVMPK